MLYPLLSLKKILEWEDSAERLGVSKVARSRRGFLTAYKRGELNENWLKKRENFIKRHMIQFRKNPTIRRYIALIMWGYDPNLTK